MSRFALVVVILAVALAAPAVFSGFGARWGWWHFRTGFGMLRWAAYGAMGVAALSLVALYRTRPGAARRGLPLALAALVIALLTFLVPWQLQRMGQRLPPIHDITTDPENPPRFVAIAPLRADAPNPIEYGGPEVAAQQRAAYPDVRSVSRVGRGDLGVNARRIRNYLEEVYLGVNARRIRNYLEEVRK